MSDELEHAIRESLKASGDADKRREVIAREDHDED